MITNCQEAAKLECIALDRPLSRWEGLRLRLHHLLCRCPVCCAHKDQLECFEKAIGDYKESMSCCERAHQKRLCEKAKERICNKLREESSSPEE